MTGALIECQCLSDVRTCPQRDGPAKQDIDMCTRSEAYQQYPYQQIIFDHGRLSGAPRSEHAYREVDRPEHVSALDGLH